ncbi:Folylpolyglutamate Synthase [Acetobacter pomorum DM001]|uniref:Folylpolyglutamate Synthase n=1 Tax=Acetobacter pomorum DM001 TaxID=945681 RepID=F1YSU2_9PROT|nr:Folylpolyglutamate Synthase [Acetobacter pomorum DM001]
MDTAFVGFTEFCPLRGKHVVLSLSSALRSLFGRPAILSHRIMSKNFALKDPDLYTASAIGGLCCCCAIIDISTQGVQRHTTFTIPFDTCDFRTAKTTRAVDTNTLCAQTHSRLHCTLHGTTESHTTFQLLSNVFCNQCSVDFWLANFNNVQRNFRASHTCQLLTERIDVLTLLTNHNTRTGGVNGYAGLFGRTFNNDTRHTSANQLATQECTQLQIFMKQF